MNEFYDSLLYRFEPLTKKLSSKFDEKVVNGLKQCVKDVYDKSSTDKTLLSNKNILPELMVEGFDLEQIWQQIELKNDFVLDKASSVVGRLSQNLQTNDEDTEMFDESASSDENDGDIRVQEPEAIAEDEALSEQDSEEEDDEKVEDAPPEDEEEISEDEIDMFGEGALDEDGEEEQYELEKPPEKDSDASDIEELERLENEALSDKPWQMKGEVSQKDRPEYSILESHLEVDITKKPPVVITEEVSKTLEELIKKRIKDGAYDDPERKTKVIETHPEFRKKLVLDQQKSKESLQEIYEKEYLNQKEKLSGEEPQEVEPESHKEIRADMNKLFAKLDALSNYHFTPRPAQPDIKVISNLPTVSLEEVVPETVSNTTLLAPEEVTKKPKGNVIGKGERTSTDRNRERRKKKLMQKQKAEKAKLLSEKRSVNKKVKSS